MRIGAGLLLIAVGAILRFGIATVSTHGVAIHTIGDILILVGILGVLLWMVMWAPWTRRRRVVYRRDVPPGQVPPAGPYPGETRYEEDYRGGPYEDEYRR
jgi:hypothetical protein